VLSWTSYTKRSPSSPRGRPTKSALEEGGDVLEVLSAIAAERGVNLDTIVQVA
jgi:hypothetical protein